MFSKLLRQRWRYTLEPIFSNYPILKVIHLRSTWHATLTTVKIHIGNKYVTSIIQSYCSIMEATLFWYGKLGFKFNNSWTILVQFEWFHSFIFKYNLKDRWRCDHLILNNFKLRCILNLMKIHHESFLNIWISINLNCSWHHRSYN